MFHVDGTTDIIRDRRTSIVIFNVHKVNVKLGSPLWVKNEEWELLRTVLRRTSGVKWAKVPGSERSCI